MARTFVIGDIHGAYRALRQCLERASFDFSEDHLISLGDVADGWPETKACIEELIAMKHVTYLLGNHDFWTLEWMQTGYVEEIWYEQGGKATIDSYGASVPEAHVRFLKNALPYCVYDNRLFVHAGIDTSLPVEEQSLQTLIWDRNLARVALDLHARGIDARLTGYDEVYIGHTPTAFGKPVQCCGIWLMDTGAGWSGNLSMMDLESKEIFTSDAVPQLYSGIPGRTRR